jgi:hypothetical protein
VSPHRVIDVSGVLIVAFLVWLITGRWPKDEEEE